MGTKGGWVALIVELKVCLGTAVSLIWARLTALVVVLMKDVFVWPKDAWVQAMIAQHRR